VVIVNLVEVVVVSEVPSPSKILQLSSLGWHPKSLASSKKELIPLLNGILSVAWYYTLLAVASSFEVMDVAQSGAYEIFQGP